MKDKFMIIDTATLNGNIVNWETANWTLGLVTTDTIPASDLCKTLPKKKYIMFPELRDINSAKELCSSLGMLNLPLYLHVQHI